MRPHFQRAVFAAGLFCSAFDGTAQSLPDNLIVTTQRASSERAYNPGNIALADTQDIQSLYPADTLNRLPGVNIQQGSGQEHLTAIRSPVLTGGAGAGSFLVMENSIGLRAAGFANVNGLMDVMLEDSARVEVVRGPGSALYGSNALHGLINVIPVDARDSGSHASALIGSYGRYRLAGASGFELGAAAARLSLDLSGEQEGERAASGFASQKFRLQTHWEAGDRSFSFSLAGMNLNQETAGYAADFRNEAVAKGNADKNAHRDAWSIRTALRIEQQLSDGKLILTPYARKNHMDFRMHFLASADPLEKNGHKSLGILSAYHRPLDGGHILIAGLDAEITRGKLWQYQTNPAIFGYLPGLHYDYEVDVKTVSPYLHAEWRWRDTTRLTTGLRYDLTDYHYTNRTSDGAFGRFLRPGSRNDDYDTLSPKIGLTHRSGHVVFFANLSRGTRAPQTTDLYRLRTGQSVGEIRPEKLDSAEIGWRTFSRPVEIEVSVFKMKKGNYYFRDSNSENVSNGKTEHEGLELSLSGALTERLGLELSASYARHLYAFSHGPNGIVAGADIDSAPRRLALIGLTYEPTSKWTISGKWHYVGRYATNEANTRFYDGHNLLDLAVRWRADEHLSLDFALDNALDRAYARRADFAFGTARYFPGAARRWSMRLKWFY